MQKMMAISKCEYEWRSIVACADADTQMLNRMDYMQHFYIFAAIRKEKNSSAVRKPCETGISVSRWSCQFADAWMRRGYLRGEREQ